MAINLVLLATTIGAGVIGGAATSIASSLVGKASIKRMAIIEKENSKKVVDECLAKNKANLKKKLFERNKKCFSCNDLIPKNSAYCPSCGIPVAGNKMCKKCGISLPDNAVHCYVCGSSASEKKENSELSDFIEEDIGDESSE